MKPISVTLLSSYLYCKRKLFLQHVLGLEEAPKEALVLGTIRHSVFDQINKLEEETVKEIKPEHELGDIVSLYSTKFSRALRAAIIRNKHELRKVSLPLDDAFRRVWQFLTPEIVVRSRNIQNFILANNVYGEELWLKLTPKIKSEYRVASEELGLKGIIDQLEVHGDRLVPIELKTGKCPEEGVWPSHRIQLAAYMLLLQEKFGTDVAEGYINYLDTQERRRIALNPFFRDEVKELVLSVNSLLSGLEAPEIEKNENKCTNCSLKEMCHNKELIFEKTESVKSSRLSSISKVARS